MQAVRFSLVWWIALAACSAEAPRAARSPGVAPEPVRSSEPQMAARVDACAAVPSTVYGEEPVSFELKGPKSERLAAVEARDAGGKVLATASVAVPGAWQVPSLPSGDFSLHVGSSNVTCSVTVNRELSRASSGSR